MQPADTAADGEAAVARATLRQELLHLSRDHRAVLALFYLEDMSVAEVAVALDIPPGTVKTRLMHARNNLRRKLEGTDHGQD